LHALDTLPATERAQLDRWAGHAAELPREACLHELFEAQARRAPEAIALLHGERQLSYAELDARAERLAQRLRQFGVAPDARVALHARRSPELVVALLAILKAGGAYVPLDPDYPAERLAQMLADSGPVALLYQGGLPDELARALDPALPKLDLDQPDFGDTDPVSAKAAERPVAHAGNLAYVIYTSGSTGVPKGVMVEHRSVVNQVTALAARLGLEAGQRMLQFASPSFDASVEEVFATLASGATLVLRSDAWLADAATFWDLCAAQRIAVVDLPTQFWTQLALARRPIPTCVRWAIIGGEAVGEAALRAWFDGPGSRPRLLNTYGPTEATVSATALEVAGVGDWRSIGRPSAKVVVRILDALGQLVPVGVAGELHIGGVQLARGYLNRPELTAERFVDDPFGEPGERLYKTGDLARWKADGTIDYLGRNDFQVKIRGFRIELGEIEARLAEVDGVREAVVLAREEAPGAAASSDVRLVAYYLGEAVEAEQLRRQLAQRLPAYMVPAAYVWLDAFPLTPNGKLDRKVLPAPDGAAYAQREYEAPQGETETTLAALWAELLKLDRVGRHDNFFELGGHSLLAVSLIERLRQAGLHSDVRGLFAASTLAELATRLGRDSQAVAVPPNLIEPGAERITPAMLPLVQLSQAEIDVVVAGVDGGTANVQDIYPLAPLQEGILFHHLSAREGDPYLVYSLLGFKDRARLDGFLAALRQVIARHDILRTGIVWQGLPQPVQVVWRQVELPLEHLVLDPADGEIADQLAARNDPRRQRLDVGRAPLLRCQVAEDAAHGRWLLGVLSHHLIDDNTTVRLLAAEARAIEQGRAAQLPPPVPFRNYVAQAASGLGRHEHELFFARLLGDIDAPTAPFGLGDAHRDGRDIAELRRPLASGLAQALRGQARRLGVSAASLFHLAWALVVARASGRRAAVFGTVLLGRMQGGAEADRALGLFINTLPLRLDVDDRPVEQAVRDVQALLAELMRHEHASLALAQRCSALPAQAPLFTALLNYRHGEEAPALDGGIEQLAGSERSNYPLTLSVDDFGRDFALTVQAAAPLAPQRVHDFMAAALAALLDALQQAPGRPLAALDVLPPAERALLLDGWNDTAADYPREACLHRLVEARAARAPDAVALEQGGRRIAYAELDAEAGRLARHLRRLGVGPDVPVAVCLDRSPELVIALLAVLKAGGAYLPLDPAYPAERLDQLLHDAAPRALLTHALLGAALAAQLCIGAARLDAACPVIDLQADAGRWQDEPAGPLPDDGLRPRHLACVIYTSGSTGVPKGVMVEHRGLVNLVAWHGRAFGLGPDSRCSSTAGLGFDASGWEIWPVLCHGGRLLLPPPAAHDPQALLDWWRAQPLDVGFLVTPLAEFACASGRANPRAHTLLIGGDRLRRWPDGLPAGQALVNNYGPTEATVVATSGRLQPGGPVHIGRPIANTRIYLLDAAMRPVPVGVAGELYIGGDGLARGYLNRPALTAERFVDDPFRPGERLYRSGDLARWLPDGTIEYLGRDDFQVKIRGFRIELGEIEAALAAVDGVREAAVLARGAAAGGGMPDDLQLVAYYSGAALAAETLRQALARRLPAHMLPAAYVRLEAFPLTPNGKLDRQALPAPDAAAYAQREYEAPQGETETRLAALWAELLKLDRIGRHDDFFALGGHSLLAVQLLSRLRTAFAVELPLAELFARPVLSELAVRLAAAAPAPMEPIAPADRSAPLPLSLAQQRLWFLSRLDDGGAAYHLSGAVRLRGVLERDALARALQGVVERHEALRTCFPLVDGRPVQQVLAGACLAIEWDDLRGRPEAEAQRRLAGHAAAPFALAEAMPLRVLLLQLDEREHLLQVVMHHIAADGWSVGLFLDELSRLYAAALAGEPDPLPPLAIQYADYAAWQRGWLAGGRFERQQAFWRDTLKDAPTLLELPSDRPRPARQDHTGASLDVRLDAALSRSLKALGRRHGSTLYMTLLASWAAVLGRLAGQDEVVIGSPVAGRNRAEVEPLIGFFVNTLALRIDLGGEPTVAELLQRTREQVLAAQQHQDLPFDQVVEAVQPPRSLAHTPLFQVMLDWHNTPRGRLELPGLAVAEVEAELPTAQFDLMLSLREDGETIAGALNYATALFDAATAARYLRHWTVLLAAMAADDGRTVSRLPLLDAAQRRQLLVDWNDTARALPLERCVHELFEAQAARTPAAIAIDDGERRLSYAELNRQANRLAHHLRALGVLPDARVALCAERGAPMLVGLLAIFKAGGAYVPLDPDYPGERIAYMLRDSTPVAALCSSAARPALQRWLERPLPVLDLEADAAQWQRQPEHDPSPRAVGLNARHLAYVIYTSGSTGRPKGVMIEHRGLVNYTLAAIDWFGLGPGERVLQQNSLNFDLSIEESLPALLSGATLLPSAELFGLVRGQDRPGPAPTMVHLTAAHWHSLVGEWSRPGADTGQLDGVRLVNVTGDALSPHKLQQWDALRPAATGLINTYGPTEITVSCSAAYVRHDPAASRVSIGRPFANTRMYLLDAHGEPVPVGVAGELHIAGEGVARGYLNLPELTDARFLADPFVPGARMYRTGDLARWRPDGEVEFIGRNDFQVKVRGFRIELGEVEARLARADGVEEVVVLAREDAPGDKRLVAYYTGAQAPSAEALRQHALQGLPQYMVPAAWVRLAALPLTPNGKLDRQALPAPDGAALAKPAYAAPEGETEAALARIWAELLGVERVGRHDNFFELGGHSLLAVSLVERMRREDLQADVTLLFTAPTLAELAAGTRKLKEILL
ncbi:non-ribosomal peptide synthetase, partial [Chitinimonas koreensis]|uniref:non-ribosomal peptide synthetase n=1 Tax=Chitinimonas koreensis TaxID=356302 RepID=UPI0012FBD0DF